MRLGPSIGSQALRLSRRQALGFLAGGAALALGGAPLATTDERAVLAAVAARLFLGSPGAGDARVVDASMACLSALPVATRLQVRGLLRAVQWEPLTRYGGRFTELSHEQQDDFLRQLATSDHYLRRLMFHGLKQLCAMGHYQHDRAWGVMGYGGPLVRP
ncbi:MAG: gluconate 2-dehydrogenase subunit 3 family protein [Alphaproteobacteria bacterium]|nr:gluconate 2-dehydrogenase subunit 3 family protein [Alphaproteobacteria bacterium]